MLCMWNRRGAETQSDYRPDLPLRKQLVTQLQQKMVMLRDPEFLDLARMGISETLQSPERARAILAKVEQREEGLTRWIRAAQADGKLKPVDPVFAGHLLQGQLKAFAFWPQIAMAQAPLASAEADALVDCVVDMFLAYYGS
jgi:TetR/AcrR family transcriptional regulator of autoinduction and epiphytic fitness